MLIKVASPSEIDYEQVRKILSTQGYVGIGFTGPETPRLRQPIIDWVADLVAQHGKPYVPHGVFKNHGAGCAPFMWQARAFVAPVFEGLWRTKDLVCSLDGFNYTDASPRVLRDPRKWLHRDQRPEDSGFKCWQGVLQFGSPGCLVVAPFSHEIRLEEATRRDWYKIPDGPMKSIALKACKSPHHATLWLWDSRLWHANREPMPGLIRTACYVCFQPRSARFDRAKRARFIEGGETTSHWPNKAAKNGKPRVRPGYIRGDPKGSIAKPPEGSTWAL